jgi:hypothetical protein
MIPYVTPNTKTYDKNKYFINGKTNNAVFINCSALCSHVSLKTYKYLIVFYVYDVYLKSPVENGCQIHTVTDGMM